MKQASKLTITGLKCDAPGCGYTQEEPNGENVDYDKWLNTPCPRCGANMLTEADLATTKNLAALTDAINELLPDYEDDSPTAIVELGMNGTGEVSIKDIKIEPEQT